MRFNKSQIERIAREFWSEASEIHRLNFDIASAVNDTKDIDLIPVQRLSLQKIESWLARRTINIDISVGDRSLHGALLIKDGSVVMFIDNSGDEIQQRFTIAHEVSHYLLDYKIPRERIIMTMGREIEDVLNGTSEATHSQLVLSVLKGISINPYTFLIEKTGNGSFLEWSNFNAENEADYLALELLAPRAMVIKETVSSIKRLNYSQFVRKSRKILTEKYRIPEEITHQYASELAYSVTNGPTFLDKLGF